MTRADLAKKNAVELAAWETRGMGGTRTLDLGSWDLDLGIIIQAP